MSYKPLFFLVLTAFVASLTLGVRAGYADHPKPSVYPTSWELKFEHSKPKRIVVDVPGQGNRAFWYMTYTVTNLTDEEQTFLPKFELLTRDGQVLRSDNNISPTVHDAIRARERNRALQTALQIAGSLRAGEDQAKEGLAVWHEPEPRMGTFTIFVTGLSGEIAQLSDDNGQPIKDSDGQPIILRKTLEATYQVPGDEVHPGEDVVLEKSQGYVMR
jgi:hypothetical protein